MVNIFLSVANIRLMIDKWAIKHLKKEKKVSSNKLTG
jgi:hypothetical protein